MGIDVGVGGGGTVAAIVDDMGGDGMQCSDHPYRNNSSPGGICAFCLQEKLGKLVSSTSPSFRSDLLQQQQQQLPTLRLTPADVTSSAPLRNSHVPTSGYSNNSSSSHNSSSKVYAGSRRARMPFQLLKNSKKSTTIASTCSSSGENQHHVVLKRSKSTATPRSGRYLTSDSNDFSPRRRGFWSFLHLSHHKKPTKELKPSLQPPDAAALTPPPPPAAPSQQAVVVVVEEGDSSPNSSGSNATSFGRKVSRSRSVGCGSRSFSGDFFERISTGFGDCTLRRVESQREGRRSTSAARASVHGRVPCGGLFGGFIITSSSSSSSFVSSAEDGNNGPGRAVTPGPGSMVAGRNRNWAWAFASPRRAFGKTTTTTMSKDGRRDIVVSAVQNSSSTEATTAPDLAAIPSLLAVRGCAIAGE